MQTILTRRSHLAAITTGLIGAVILLTMTSRTGMAEKAIPDPDKCGAGYASLCKLVETCTPKGFEANGTCKWIYTAAKSYWK